MVAFNFKPEFVDQIRSGAKMQTVRATKRCKPGDTMHLFTGMRTKACNLIATRPCVVVDYVHLAPDGITLGNTAKHPQTWDEFAQLDGFRDYDQMLGWFRAQYGSDHFIGTVHRWAATPEHVPVLAVDP